MMPEEKPTPPKAASGSRAPMAGKLTLLWMGAVVVVVLAVMLPWGHWFPSAKNGEVVVYAAQDQVYAEPILKEFTRQAGIKVKTLFDSEAVKTVGLANRLLAETNRPQADVFWGNEELRTRQLAAREVWRATNGWAAFGFRSRRIVVNTNKVAGFDSTRVMYLRELTNANWRGKVALAYPMFGTTATHFHALRQYWGAEAWERWCRALMANRPLLVDGNSVVVNLVGRGEAWFGLTDSDDIAAGKKQKFPVIALPITEETLMIPNTVALVRNGPNPAQAGQLFAYLQTRAAIEPLLAVEALESTRISLRPHLKVKWEALLQDFDDTNERMKRIFLR